MGLFKKGEWSILWPFYISQLIYSLFIFFGPYMIIYFLDIGLSFFQISIIMAVFCITPLIFEIPTGAIADIYGRKFSVILGWILAGIFITSVFFTTNFYLLMLIFFLWGFSTTLMSGADQAWIVDLLKHKRKKELTQEYFVKSYSIGSFGVIFMGILSALFVKYFGMKGIWIVSGVATIISALILLKAKEYFKREKVNFKQTLNKAILNSKKGLIYSFKHRNLLLFILAVAFVAISVSMSSNMWQAFLRDIGLKPYLLGYIYSIIAIFTVVTPYLSKPLLKKIGKEKYYLALITFFVFLVTLSIYYVNIILLALAIMILINIFDSLDNPVSSTFFHKFVPSKTRATIGSVNSMFSGVAAVIGLLIAGLVADIVGAQMTIFYSSFFLIPVIIFYLMIKQK